MLQLLMPSGVLLLRRVLKAYMRYVTITFLKRKANMELVGLGFHFASSLLFLLLERLECEGFLLLKWGLVFHSGE